MESQWQCVLSELDPRSVCLPNEPICPRPTALSTAPHGILGGAEPSTEPLPPGDHSQAPPGTLRGQNVTARDEDCCPDGGLDASEPDFMTGGHRMLSSTGIVVSQAEERPDPTPIGGCHGASPGPLPTPSISLLRLNPLAPQQAVASEPAGGTTWAPLCLLCLQDQLKRVEPSTQGCWREGEQSRQSAAVRGLRGRWPLLWDGLGCGVVRDSGHS